MSPSRDNLPVVEEPKPSVAEMVQALPRKIFTREAALWIVAILLGGVAFAQGMERLDGGVEKKLAPLEQKVDRHITESDAKQAALEKKFDGAEERNARRFEVLYNAVLERRPQPGADELMKPATTTDGGR